MMIFGAIYFLVPRITGQAWASSTLIRAHYLTAIIGTTALVAALAVAGWVQGHDLNDPAVTFAVIAGHTKTWLQVATAAQALLVLGNLLLLGHLLKSAVSSLLAPATATFRQPPTMEASVS